MEADTNLRSSEGVTSRPDSSTSQAFATFSIRVRSIWVTEQDNVITDINNEESSMW